MEQVISDTELTLKDPGAQMHQPDADYSYKILPKIDQSSVYKFVYEHLGNNGAIGIFPEGGSHD